MKILNLKPKFQKDNLIAYAYLAGWKLVGVLPQRCAEWLFRCGADFASGQGRGPEQLRKNLARVVGPSNVTSALVRDSMRSYMRYWMEAFRLPSIHNSSGLHDELIAGAEGLEHFDAALSQGRGVILALPHSGNWDMAGVFLVGHSGTFSTVAERLRPEMLFDAFVNFRTKLGFDVVGLTGSTPPFEKLAERLRSGGVVCLLSERDLKGTGVPVDFFGEKASFAAGPAALAKETGAALLVVHLWFNDSKLVERTSRQPRWGISFSPEVKVDSVEATTQRIANLFARNISQHPADWHMLQPLWNKDLRQTRRKKDRGFG